MIKRGMIYKALSGFYYVWSDGASYACRARGNFRNRGISPLVGDDVSFQVENETDGYILEVHERKNELVRPPVSNIDHVLVVMSAKEPNLSLNLLDKFLVTVEGHDITPSIIITKRDLLSNDEIRYVEEILEHYEKVGYKTYFISNLEDQEAMSGALVDGINVLSGQSGVGKSSLINAMLQMNIQTGIISNALNRGKHTTRHVELINTPHGFLADTPGFSALDFIHIEKHNLKNCFPEFVQAADNCKFRECLHINEPKCQVKENVKVHIIMETRYKHYLQMMKEIESRKVRY